MKSRNYTYEKYDKELDFIVMQLNNLYAQAEPLHKRYTEIMQYYRQQKRRGLITEEEYKERANRFKYKRMR